MANKDFEVHPCSHCLPCNKASAGIDSDNAVDASMSAHGLFARLLRIPLVQFYLTIRSDSLVFAFHLHAMNISPCWSSPLEVRFDLFDDEFSRL